MPSVGWQALLMVALLWGPVDCGRDPAPRAVAHPISSSAAGSSPPAVAAGRRSLLDASPRAAGARVPRIASVRDYRRSGDDPYWLHGPKPRWTPREIVQILREDPDYLVDMGIWTERPTGHSTHREVGRVVNEVQALARAAGVDAGRLAFSVRNDVFAKHKPGSPRCGKFCGWEGTMVGAPFDPGWIMTVPRSEQRWAIEHRWGGDERMDPWSPQGRDLWPPWLDRVGMAAANSPTRVGELYGGVHDRNGSRLGRDWTFGVSAIVMDLRQPAYRAWSVKRLIANLHVLGIDPGESAVLIYGYKPGWHTYYGGPRSVRQACFVPGSHMWIGPAGPCSTRLRPVAGPFPRTPYGPGEFETAVNAMLREMRAGLVAAGYPGVKIVTVERPTFDRTWSVLEPDLRRAPWILGELGAACQRLDVARSGPCPLL